MESLQTVENNNYSSPSSIYSQLLGTMGACCGKAKKQAEAEMADAEPTPSQAAASAAAAPEA